MIANLMLAAALMGVHTPETSKLFERRTDPESGVVSYSLVYGAPDDNRQSLYFVTKSMTEDGRFLHDLATGRQERWCGIAGARHNNVSPDNRYVVCDEAPEAWWRGCKWRVAFWNRETERGVWIYSTRPALMPREKPSRLHPDPHPHFVMNGRYVVCTANNADGHMDLYVTPVDQLVRMTTP